MISTVFNRKLANSIIGYRQQIDVHSALCSDTCTQGCTEARCLPDRIGEASKASAIIAQ